MLDTLIVKDEEVARQDEGGGGGRSYGGRREGRHQLHLPTASQGRRICQLLQRLPEPGAVLPGRAPPVDEVAPLTQAVNSEGEIGPDLALTASSVAFRNPLLVSSHR